METSFSFLRDNGDGKTWLEFPGAKADPSSLFTQVLVLAVCCVYFPDGLMFLAWITHFSFGLKYILTVHGDSAAVAHLSFFLLGTLVLVPVLSISLSWSFFGKEKVLMEDSVLVLKRYIFFLLVSKQRFDLFQIQSFSPSELGKGIVLQCGKNRAIFGRGLKKDEREQVVGVIKGWIGTKSLIHP